MNANRRTTTILGFSILGAAIGLWAWSGVEVDGTERSPHARVRVEKVQTTTAGRASRVSGVTRAARRAVLAFPVSARLAARTVEVGQHVSQGQVLAQLDEQPFRHAFAAAEAVELQAQVAAQQAERDRSRVEQLVASKAATREELEHVTAAEEAARAGLASARAQQAEARRIVDETTLRAPFSGTVTAALVEPGEQVAAGMPVVELSGDGAVELRVEVSENVVGGLRAGQNVEVELPLAGHVVVNGRVASVAAVALGPGRLFPVLVDLDPHPSLRAGLTAELVVRLTKPEALTVPLHAVLNPGASDPTVFVLVGTRVSRRHVQVGDLVDGRVLVTGEVQGGDQVVVAGHTRLADGDEVEVLR